MDANVNAALTAPDREELRAERPGVESEGAEVVGGRVALKTAWRSETLPATVLAVHRVCWSRASPRIKPWKWGGCTWGDDDVDEGTYVNICSKTTLEPYPFCTA